MTCTSRALFAFRVDTTRFPQLAANDAQTKGELRLVEKVPCDEIEEVSA